MFKLRQAFAQRLISFKRLSVVVFLLLLANSLSAGPIPVPNSSFESPTTFFVTLNLDNWQRTPQPGWWDTNTSGQWETLVGFFKNTPVGAADHIANCHGNQAMWLFARPEAGLFQDYDSVDWNDPAPTHAFDAKFEAGKSYRLTVGLLVGGMANGGGVTPGATVDFSLYYRDATSNRIAVATTTITNSLTVFSNSTFLLDFFVEVPVVRPGDAWAGKNIGILLLSSVPLPASPEEETGGYWDLDNVRLTATLAPTLINPARSTNQFQFTLESEPGMIVEILASTNAALATANWSSIGLITNTTGTIPFIDTFSNFDQRFYQARQLP